MGVDVGRHLRLQGDREHLPRSLAHDLIEHEPLASLGSASSWTTLSMGVFPTGAPTPAHDQTCYGLSIFLGKVRPFTSPRRGPSTGSDHCSRLLDDPQIQQKIGAILRRSGLTRSTGINVPQRWYP